MEFLIVLAVLAIVVFVVTSPLRRQVTSVALERKDVDAVSEAAALEAAREAKYREIRDAELDHLTGKLSDADFAAIDQTLRVEAIEILHALDREDRAAVGQGQNRVASAAGGTAGRADPPGSLD